MTIEYLDLSPEGCRKWAAWHRHHAEMLEDRARDAARSGMGGEAAEGALRAATDHRRFANVLEACADDQEQGNHGEAVA